MTRNQVLIQQLITAALFLGVLVMLAWLSNRFTLEVDWTAGNRNTLTEPSRKLLATLDGPVEFKIFAYPRSEGREALEADIRRYQRVKADITLEFVDPTTHPQEAREYNIRQPGEAVVVYQGRHENLAATTEQAITGALQRLAITGETWVVFLEGHGERSIGDTEQSGYSQFADFLRNKGLKLRTLNLATDPRVPDNTAVLVIASPARSLLEGETRIVDEYVRNGGNLLWLADPAEGVRDPVTSLGPLAQTLGVTWQKGTGILLESASLGLPPFIYIMTQYPPNPVTHDFPENAFFPLVRGVIYKSDDAGWNGKPMLLTSEQAWLETGKLEGELALDEKQGDIAGPLTLGVTLTREIKTPAADKPTEGAPPAEPVERQRVALIGDSDFLSNAYIAQLGNSLLGLNLAQWLAARDEMINVDVGKAPDRNFDLSRVGGEIGLNLIFLLFLFLLPAALLGFGVTRWVLRRRA